YGQPASISDDSGSAGTACVPPSATLNLAVPAFPRVVTFAVTSQPDASLEAVTVVYVMLQGPFSLSSTDLTIATAPSPECAAPVDDGAAGRLRPKTRSSPKPPQAGFVWWMSSRRTVSPTCPSGIVMVSDG